MTPEGEVKNVLKKRLLKIFGEDAYAFWPVQMGYGSRTNDCILCHKGCYIMIETKKSPKENLRRAQWYVLWRVVKAGGKAFVIDNVRDAATFDPNAPGLTDTEIVSRFKAQSGDLSDARAGPDSLQRFDGEGDR